ncbi:uncharacterized protein NEMAJ01_1858 [Nematocida major]|uniref:uncharacterized protein n=1 Tax=Nematocida major TaxID=1912982 RepID=UPI0020079B50|nr:uncharacterized protein NEMAJ01_1858 [Nematocida major]KAH9386962.1 hypothetical protein NEMAJ01_1858 [Nematocida major]
MSSIESELDAIVFDEHEIEEIGKSFVQGICKGAKRPIFSVNFNKASGPGGSPGAVEAFPEPGNSIVQAPIESAEVGAQCAEISVVFAPISADCVESSAMFTPISAECVKNSDKNPELSVQCAENNASCGGSQSVPELSAQRVKSSGKPPGASAQHVKNSAVFTPISAQCVKNSGESPERSAQCAESSMPRGSSRSAPGVGTQCVENNAGLAPDSAQCVKNSGKIPGLSAQSVKSGGEPQTKGDKTPEKTGMSKIASPLGDSTNRHRLSPTLTRASTHTPLHWTRKVCIEKSETHTENPPKPILPAIGTGPSDSIWRVSVHTVFHLLQTGQFLLVDCRFAYEFEGGHIHTALNISSKKDMNFLFRKLLHKKEKKKFVIILYCEYSSVRAPRMALFLRNQDRLQSTYPELLFPNVYVMEGGYKDFFRSYPEMCVPRNYTPM